MLCATLFAIASMLLGLRAFAQTEPTSNSATIAIANKFQQIVPASGAERKAVTIKNNNTNNDICWLYIGSDKATKDNSIALDPGTSYVRYWPLAPTDAIQATCASSSDSLLVEYQ
jgi:hypothetical protein